MNASMVGWFLFIFLIFWNFVVISVLQIANKLPKIGRKYKSKPKRVFALICLLKPKLSQVFQGMSYYFLLHSSPLSINTSINTIESKACTPQLCTYLRFSLFVFVLRRRESTTTSTIIQMKRVKKKFHSKQFQYSTPWDIVPVGRHHDDQDAPALGGSGCNARTTCTKCTYVSASMVFTSSFPLLFISLRHHHSRYFFFEHVIGEKTQTKKKKIMCAMVVQTSWSTRALFCL